jgi:hypothetical protein
VKTLTWNRLARLEAQQSHHGANKSDSKQFKFKMAITSIVAFHAGALTPADSFATALARGLCITTLELKTALSPDNHDRFDLWARVLEKLNDLSASRGGPPMIENGSLIFEGSQENDDGSGGLEMLDQLYDEIPNDLKERHRLLPHLRTILCATVCDRAAVR